MISPFLLLALGTIASEDLTCIAAGVLIAQGVVSFNLGVFACLAGIVSGDLLLFLAGRSIGRRVLDMPVLQRLVSPARLEQASIWLQGKELTAVLLSRFTPGLRLATYFAAGSLRMRFWSFASYFLLASIVWTPLLVGSTVSLGDRLLKSIFSQSHNLAAFAVVFCIAACNLYLSRRLSTVKLGSPSLGPLTRFTRRERRGAQVEEHLAA